MKYTTKEMENLKKFFTSVKYSSNYISIYIYLQAMLKHDLLSDNGIMYILNGKTFDPITPTLSEYFEDEDEGEDEDKIILIEFIGFMSKKGFLKDKETEIQEEIYTHISFLRKHNLLSRSGKKYISAEFNKAIVRPLTSAFIRNISLNEFVNYIKKRRYLNKKGVNFYREYFKQTN